MARQARVSYDKHNVPRPLGGAARRRNRYAHRPYGGRAA